MDKLRQYESNLEDPSVTMELVAQAFRKARQMLTEGKLSVLQKLVELYVQRVVVYQDRIEVFFNMGSDAYPPGLDDNRKHMMEKEKCSTFMDGANSISKAHTYMCAELSNNYDFDTI